MPESTHGEAEADQRVLLGLRLTVELSVLVLLVEAVGALFSRSLSLTLDAVHNVPDILAFTTSWAALRATREGTSAFLTFGPHRMEVFASLLNAALVIGSATVFGYAAVVSLVARSPFEGSVDAVWLLAAAFPTLGLRAGSLYVLRRVPGRVRDLNLRSVVLHLGSDLAITGSLLVAGAILVLRPSAGFVDPLASLVIAAVLFWESGPLLRDSWDVLSERVPRSLSVDAVVRTALAVRGVRGFHDLHVWSVCPTLVCLTAHVEVDDVSVSDWATIVAELRRTMRDEFGILHAVFEPESASSA